MASQITTLRSQILGGLALITPFQVHTFIPPNDSTFTLKTCSASKKKFWVTVKLKAPNSKAASYSGAGNKAVKYAKIFTAGISQQLSLLRIATKCRGKIYAQAIFFTPLPTILAWPMSVILTQVSLSKSSLNIRDIQNGHVPGQSINCFAYSGLGSNTYKLYSCRLRAVKG